ncbi:MAG: hypothetical protein ABIP95_00730 [Pelobium sp.]
MDISPHFATLIAQKDQLVVPGLGRFYKKRVAGYYEEETKTFHPPTKEIDFSMEYMHDDKLVQYISQEKNTSLTSAYAILDEYVRDLKVVLKKQAVDLLGIGSLVLEDEKILLKEKKEAKLNKTFFGLPTIDTQSSNFIGEEEEHYTLAQQALDTAMPDDYEEERPRSSRVKIFVMLFIIAIIAGLVALYIVKPEIYQGIYQQLQRKENTKAVPPSNMPSQEFLNKADSIYNSKQDIEAKLKAQGFDVEKAKDSTDVSINEKTLKNNGIRYEIIISQFQKRSEAVERVALLKQNGINAFIVDDADGPLVKVSCATFYNETEAKIELNRVREELNPEAFIKPIKTLKK